MYYITQGSPNYALKPSNLHTALFQEGSPFPSLSTSPPLPWLTPAYLSKSNLGSTSTEKACQAIPTSGEVDAFPVFTYHQYTYPCVIFFQYNTIVYSHVWFSTINLKVGTRLQSVSSEPVTMPDA